MSSFVLTEVLGAFHWRVGALPLDSKHSAKRQKAYIFDVEMTFDEEISNGYF
jgi:hypothetical protein